MSDSLSLPFKISDPAPFDIVTPIVDAISTAVGNALGIVRAVLADTVGQFVVALYTPIYCIADFLIAVFQIIFGLLEMVFGFLPQALFLAVLWYFFMLILGFMLRLAMHYVFGR